MHKLYQELAQRVGIGLRRKSITTCSKWACEYRLMGQPFVGRWTFDHHPWLRDIHDDKAELVIGQKAAQMGYTETALNKSFFNIDILAASVLYVLPASKPDATDFSTSRFDPALESSPHLRNLFTDVKNINHKRAGYANLFIRGSRSRSQMKSVPAGLVILDEVDEMNQDNISLVFERVSGQVQKQIMMLSTPTIDKFGINYYFRQSDQRHFFFVCPSCGKWTELIYPDCLVITAEDIIDPNIKNSHLICKECKAVLPHETKIEWLKGGKWVPTYTDRTTHGYHISQLYSMTAHPADLARKFFNAKKDPADEQDFFNSKLGVTHAVEGAQVNDKQLNDCIGDFKQMKVANGLLTLGIDVGADLHYIIKQWIKVDDTTSDINARSTCRTIRFGKVKNFEDLDQIMRKYPIRAAVIDANPERRKAFEFASRFYGYVKLCFYGRGITGKQISTSSEEEMYLTVDRTSWMDASLSRYKNGSIKLPQDIDQEFRDHIKAPVRIYEKDSQGNQTGKYVTGNEADHYAHADTYAEIALQLAVAMAKNEDIR